MNFYVIAVFFNFLLIGAGAYLNRHTIIGYFRGIGRQGLFFFAAILVLAFFLRAFVVPHRNIMYIDEPWNMEAAKNIIREGGPVICSYIGPEVQDCTYYPKPFGFPFLLSIAFLLFGVDVMVAIWVSVILGTLSVAFVFLLGYALFRNSELSFWAALLFALFPAHVKWSGTAETNVASVFFMLLAVLSVLLYAKTGERKLLYITVPAISFSIQIRPEDVLVVVVAVIATVLFGNKKRIRKDRNALYLASSGLFLLALPHLLHMAETLGSGNLYTCEGSSCHSVLGWANFVDNWEHWNPVSFFRSSFNSIVPGLLSAAGFLLLWRDKFRKEALFLGFWLFLYYFTLLLYWGAQEDRRYLNIYAPLAFFGGYTLLRLQHAGKRLRVGKKAAVLLLVLTVFLLFYPSAESVYKNKGRFLETRLPVLMKESVPEKCYVVAEWPEVVTSTLDFRGIRTSYLLKNPSFFKNLSNSSPCVLYLEDMYCIAAWDQPAVERCKKIRSRYNLTQFLQFSYGTEDYALYRMSKKNSSKSTTASPDFREVISRFETLPSIISEWERLNCTVAIKDSIIALVENRRVGIPVCWRGPAYEKSDFYPAKFEDCSREDGTQLDYLVRAKDSCLFPLDAPVPAAVEHYYAVTALCKELPSGDLESQSCAQDEPPSSILYAVIDAQLGRLYY